jgi:hypothetical protein
MARPEGQRPHFERTSQQRTSTEQPKPHQEGGNASPGLPPTVHERAKPPPESQERHPLPSVWDILERKVSLDECYVGLERYSVPESFRDLREAREYYREQREVKRLEEELREKGTARDKLILHLFDSITLQLGSGEPIYRYLLRAEFQQLSSKVVPLSDEEIAEEIHKQNEYSKQIGQESGLFDEPERRGLFESSIIGELMLSPELVDRKLVEGRITEEEAIQKKKEALQRDQRYQEDERIQGMLVKGLITQKEALGLRRLREGLDSDKYFSEYDRS